MASPLSGASGVATSVGTLILEVLDPWPVSGLRVTDPSGADVRVAPTAVPSPLPAGLPGNGAYEAVSLPALAPMTTYKVSQAANTSPSCSALYQIGAFTTE